MGDFKATFVGLRATAVMKNKKNVEKSSSNQLLPIIVFHCSEKNLFNSLFPFQNLKKYNMKQKNKNKISIKKLPR